MKFLFMILGLGLLGGIGVLAVQNAAFLNKNSGVFMIIFTFVVALATVVYAVLTWKLVEETTRSRKVQTEPKVTVVYQPREEGINWMDLVIKNIGQGPAYDITLSVEPDFEHFEGQLLSNLNMFKNGLNYLNPSQKVQFFFTSLLENFQKKIDNPFSINITYKNEDGKKYSEEFRIDFSELVGIGDLGEPPFHSMAKSLKKIQEEISHFSSGFHKLNTIVHTKKELDKELQDLLKARRKRRQKTKGAQSMASGRSIARKKKKV